jgi:hypothetical protein
MLVAIGLLLTFLGRPVRRAAAIVGGVGFGFFIDELGKFVTQDNDYSFRPAAALVYLIFVGLFLVARAIRERGRFGVDAPLASAVDLLGEAARGHLDEDGRRAALTLLARSDPADPLVAPLRAVLADLAARPVAPPGPWERLVGSTRTALDRLTSWRGFPIAVAWLFRVWAVTAVTGALWRLGDASFVNLASLTGSVVSLALVVAGRYERALLVGIFVTQVFAFVTSQFGAVFGLGVDLALLWMLRAMQAGPLDARPVSPAAGRSRLLRRHRCRSAVVRY